MTIWFFHGFLGQGSDWDQVIENWGSEHLCLAPDFFSRESQPIETFDAWSERFHREILLEVEPPFVGVGYSMGGRLLLHLAKKYPHLWRDLFLLSSSVGWLMSDEQKLERMKNDEDWAERFLYGDWDETVEDWNAQTLLEGSTSPVRSLWDFDRAKLSRALRLWSPAHHTVQRDDFLSTPYQVHHWVGEDDVKYKNEQFKLLHGGLNWDFQVYAGGHRFPFEKPERLRGLLKPHLEVC